MRSITVKFCIFIIKIDIIIMFNLCDIEQIKIKKIFRWEEIYVHAYKM